MEENKTLNSKLNLIDRKELSISGVIKVLSSNNNLISLKLSTTDLEIMGSNLTIKSFNENNISIEGLIDIIKYTKTSKKKECFIKRIFR